MRGPGPEPLRPKRCAEPCRNVTLVPLPLRTPSAGAVSAARRPPSDAASPARYASSRISTGWRVRTPVARLDLPAAGLGVARRGARAGRPDLLEQRRADVHRDVVLLLLEAVRAGDPAAVVVHVPGAAGPARARTGRAPAARSRGSGAGTAHGRGGPRRARRSPCRAGPGRGGRARNSQMSQVASATTFASSSSRSSISAVLGLERVGARRRGADDPVAGAGVRRRGPSCCCRPARGRRRTGRC